MGHEWLRYVPLRHLRPFFSWPLYLFLSTLAEIGCSSYLGPRGINCMLRMAELPTTLTTHPPLNSYLVVYLGHWSFACFYYSSLAYILTTVVPCYPHGIGSRIHRGYENLQMLKSHGQPSISVSMVLHLQIQPTVDHVVVQYLLKKNPCVSRPASLNTCCSRVNCTLMWGNN